MRLSFEILINGKYRKGRIHRVYDSSHNMIGYMFKFKIYDDRGDLSTKPKRKFIEDDDMINQDGKKVKFKEFLKNEILKGGN